MIVQWCLKGMHLPDDDTARSIIDSGRGLVCNWWRDVGTITPAASRSKLTIANLDRHINHFSAIDPVSGEPFSTMSPFISLSAGTIERDPAAQTNHVRSARQTALWFGTEFGNRTTAYLFTCWVLLAPRSAVEVEGIAEEIRDLNTYRRYSPFQTEGEIVAKVIVPANQLRDCQKWTQDPRTGALQHEWTHPNSHGFSEPKVLSNVRELI